MQLRTTWTESPSHREVAGAGCVQIACIVTMMASFAVFELKAITVSNYQNRERDSRITRCIVEYAELVLWRTRAIEVFLPDEHGADEVHIDPSRTVSAAQGGAKRKTIKRFCLFSRTGQHV